MNFKISLFLFFISFPVAAQPVIIKQDPIIKQMTDEISAENIEVIIRKLVSFGTRHSASDTTSTKPELVLLEIG